MFLLKVAFVFFLSKSVICFDAFATDFQGQTGHNGDSLKVDGERGKKDGRHSYPCQARDAPIGKGPHRRPRAIRNDRLPGARDVLRYKISSIVGPDDRIRIKPADTQRLPFRAIVKVQISPRVGSCSGVLIGPFHVLSAAHCFHDGDDFLASKRALSVGILQRNKRFTWYRVKDVFLPRALYDARLMNPEFDYAVLTLRRSHGRPFLHIKALSMKNLQHFKAMHFACFPNDKRGNTMWYSSCPIGWQPNSTSYRTVIMNKCDAVGGCSGAGAYVVNSGRNRYVIGVLSGTVTNKSRNVNVVTRLTPKKVKEICGWIGKSRCRQRANP